MSGGYHNHSYTGDQQPRSHPQARHPPQQPQLEAQRPYLPRVGYPQPPQRKQPPPPPVRQTQKQEPQQYRQQPPPQRQPQQQPRSHYQQQPQQDRQQPQPPPQHQPSSQLPPQTRPSSPPATRTSDGRYSVQKSNQPPQHQQRPYPHPQHPQHHVQPARDHQHPTYHPPPQHQHPIHPQSTPSESQHHQEYARYEGPRINHQSPAGGYGPPQSNPSEDWQDFINILPSRVDLARGTVRFRGTMRGASQFQYSQEGELEQEEVSVEELLDHLSTMRARPWTLARRRATRDQLRRKLASMKVMWYSMPSFTSAVRKSRTSISNVLKGSYLWAHVLKRIEGKYGTSVVAVFNFMRAMIQLNLVLMLLLLLGVVVPTAILGAQDDQEVGWHTASPQYNCSNRPDDICSELDYGIDAEVANCNLNYTTYVTEVMQEHKGHFFLLLGDFLQGSGFLEWTLLFSGYYPVSVEGTSYKASLAYILTVLTAYLLSMIYVVYFFAKFIRQSHKLIQERSMTYTNAVFAGWDFTISVPSAAKVHHSLVVNEVKAMIDDEKFVRKKSNRTRNEKIILYLTRTLINVFVFSLIAGAWAGIYYLIQKDFGEVNKSKEFLWEYAPIITISALNLIYPVIFNIIVKYEQYRGRTELLLTLARCAFIRLTSLGMMIITELIMISNEAGTCETGNPYTCWETHIGKQLYSLLILDFLIQLGMNLVVNVLRKQLRRFDNAMLNAAGTIEFFIPGHVLDIVYIQVLCWLGILYSPLLLVACFLYLCVMFGLKLFTVSWTCVPSNKVFRASRSSAMFMSILSITFLATLITNGVAVLDLCPSKACSPFRGLGRAWEVFTYYICAAVSWFRMLVFSLDNTVVASVLVIVAVLLLTYYSSLIQARSAMIRHLEKKLKSISQEKGQLAMEYKKARLGASGGPLK